MRHSDEREPRAWGSIFRSLPAHLMLAPKVVRVMQSMKSGEVIATGELCSILHEHRDVMLFACGLIESIGWCIRCHNFEGLIAWQPTDKLPTVDLEFESNEAAELHLLIAASMWSARLERLVARGPRCDS